MEKFDAEDHRAAISAALVDRVFKLARMNLIASQFAAAARVAAIETEYARVEKLLLAEIGEVPT